MKRFKLLLLSLLLLLSSCAEDNTMTVIFDVDTGDTVTVKLDMSDGYTMDYGETTYFMLDGETVMEFIFIGIEEYNSYLDAIYDVEYFEVVSEFEKDGNQCILFYADSGDFWEYDYILRLGNTDTAMLFGSLYPLEVAEDCFSHITISVE